MDSGFVRKDSTKVLESDGSDFSNDCCDSTSFFSFSSSYQAFESAPGLGFEDTAPAIAIAAEDPPAPPDAASGAPPDLMAWIVLLRASLIVSASTLAAVGDVKVKVWVSEVDVPGA